MSFPDVTPNVSAFAQLQERQKRGRQRSERLTSTLSRDVERLSLALRTPAGDESVASVLDGRESSESRVNAASGLSGRERRPYRFVPFTNFGFTSSGTTAGTKTRSGRTPVAGPEPHCSLNLSVHYRSICCHKRSFLFFFNRSTMRTSHPFPR